MNEIIERKLKSFQNNLNNLAYYDKLKEYNKVRQIIENSRDAYAYFVMNIFDKFIYKAISNKDELKESIEEVRLSLNNFSNQIRLLFPKALFLLKEENSGFDYTMDRILIEKFQMKLGTNNRVNEYKSIVKHVSAIIDSVDYIYLNNINLKDVNTRLGKELTTNLETNEILSFDHIVYNTKQSIKRILKLYE